mmetsp:Transcript_7320/g.15972  ORF Transcript_7320/g.15972 Transcript_7320/m.15972 type:complete len:81 (-) Transcript_7320:471-713(-)
MCTSGIRQAFYDAPICSMHMIMQYLMQSYRPATCPTPSWAAAQPLHPQNTQVPSVMPAPLMKQGTFNCVAFVSGATSFLQ